MGSVILNATASLDGFIARKNGDVSWLNEFHAGGEDRDMSEFMSGIGAMVMGAKTFRVGLELVGGDWPDKSTPTYVVSNRKLKPPAPNIRIRSGNLASLVREIRQQTSKKIWHMGGGELFRSFLKDGLIDEVWLGIIPIVLGDGIPLFGRSGQEVRLKLLEAKPFRSGAVMARYEVVKSGRAKSVSRPAKKRASRAKATKKKIV